MAAANAKTQETKTGSNFMEQFKRVKRIEEQFEKSNSFEIFGVVSSKYVTDPRLKKDKDGNTKLDQKGEPLYYPQKVFIDLAFLGGSHRFELNERFKDVAEVGSKFVVKGHLGVTNNFGNQEFGLIVDDLITLDSMLDGVDLPI